MPSIKEYTDKLKSLKNTQKMTKTMKMVSASKLRRAQDAQKDASVYAQRLTAMIARLAASVPDSAHALLEGRPVKKVLLVAFSSDRGLCAGFNNNLINGVLQGEINAHSRGLRTLALLIHRRLKSIEINANSMLFSNLLGELQGKPKRVVQLKRLKT